MIATTTAANNNSDPVIPMTFRTSRFRLSESSLVHWSVGNTGWALARAGVAVLVWLAELPGLPGILFLTTGAGTFSAGEPDCFERCFFCGEEAEVFPVGCGLGENLLNIFKITQRTRRG